MSLSTKQTSLYWNTWNSVCEFMGWKTSDKVRRYALHGEAGCPQSMTAFYNEDFDKFLTYCAKLLGRTNKKEQERSRLVWRIRTDALKGGLSEEYLTMLARDLYGLGCWDELALDDLTKFRNTIHNRAASHNKTKTVAAEVEAGMKEAREAEEAFLNRFDIPF